MATVMQDYRNSVRYFRPTARCAYVMIEGMRFFQIKDGEELLSGIEGSMETAWREADAYLHGLVIAPTAAAP